MKPMKFTAAGDAMIFRPLPEAYAGFEEVKSFIAQGDFRFVNLETTVHKFESCGNATSGGSWFCSHPRVLDAIKDFGFNMLTTANNHALDYTHTGLLKTLEYIEQAGLQTCGTGKTLADATAPVYLDTPSGRIALIGACSTFAAADPAGEQTRTLPGRPGLNAIRYDTVYDVTKEQMDALSDIADGIMINASREISRKEGYLPPLPEGTFEFGELRFRQADKPDKHTFVNETDMRRVETAIAEARFMADYVIISMHSHELKARSKEEPAEFFEDFCHRCIDAGANAVIGTGPHLLRPIEIYKGCPIFYSLGDFIIELETVEKAPAGMYEKQGLTGNEGLDMMFNARSDFGKKGLYYSKVMFESVVPYWEAENGKITKLTLLPVELNFDKPRSQGGLPRPMKDGGILERLAEMSNRYGTKITIENGIGTVEL